MNRRPPACKAGALPTELYPHKEQRLFSRAGSLRAVSMILVAENQIIHISAHITVVIHSAPPLIKYMFYMDIRNTACMPVHILFKALTAYLSIKVTSKNPQLTTCPAPQCTTDCGKSHLSVTIAPFPYVVPLAGIEPARDFSHGILSPGCLPIPPQRHRRGKPLHLYQFTPSMLTIAPEPETVGILPSHCSYLIFSISSGVSEEAILRLASASALAAI